MEVHFRSKEESKKEQEKAFLALTPYERFALFVHHIKQSNQFYGQTSPYPEGSFVIYRKEDKNA